MKNRKRRDELRGEYDGDIEFDILTNVGNEIYKKLFENLKKQDSFPKTFIVSTPYPPNLRIKRWFKRPTSHFIEKDEEMNE